MALEYSIISQKIIYSLEIDTFKFVEFIEVIDYKFIDLWE